MNAYDIRRLAQNIIELDSMIISDRYKESRKLMEASRADNLAMLQQQAAGNIWEAMKGEKHSPVIAFLEAELTRRAYAR